MIMQRLVMIAPVPAKQDMHLRTAVNVTSPTLIKKDGSTKKMGNANVYKYYIIYIIAT